MQRILEEEVKKCEAEGRSAVYIEGFKKGFIEGFTKGYAEGYAKVEETFRRIMEGESNAEILQAVDVPEEEVEEYRKMLESARQQYIQVSDDT